MSYRPAEPVDENDYNDNFVTRQCFTGNGARRWLIITSPFVFLSILFVIVTIAHMTHIHIGSLSPLIGLFTGMFRMLVILGSFGGIVSLFIWLAFIRPFAGDRYVVLAENEDAV